MSTALTTAPLACPIDALALNHQNGSLICPDGHSYDVASTGYINLLPVQLKASKDPGDSKAMIQARRRVLDGGLFTPLANVTTGIVSQCLGSSRDNPRCIVDAGCGEGFYTEHFRQRAVMDNPDIDTQVLGVDISKWAVQSAAKRYTDIAWIVGNNKQLPIQPGCPTVITSLFGFETWQPWFDLQKSGQYVITVDAGPRHLYELRELIYDDVNLHEAPSDAAATAAGYTLTEKINIKYENEVSSLSLLQDLAAMTPHGYRTKPQNLQSPSMQFPATMTIDTVLRLYTKA